MKKGTRRADGELDADVVHHAGDLSVHGPSSAASDADAAEAGAAYGAGRSGGLAGLIHGMEACGLADVRVERQRHIRSLAPDRAAAERDAKP